MKFIGTSEITDYNKKIQDFTNLYSGFVKPNDWCLDVGANCGDSSFAIAKHMEIQKSFTFGKIICFEPNIEAFYLLNENIQENGLTSIFDTYNFVANTYYGYEQMCFSANNDNGGIIRGFSETERGEIKNIRNIRCVNLCDFLLQKYDGKIVRKLKFIKIDVEGYDVVLLENLKPIIEISKPNIIIEWWAFEEKQEQIFSTIENINYKAYNSITRKMVSKADFVERSDDLILLPK